MPREFIQPDGKPLPKQVRQYMENAPKQDCYKRVDENDPVVRSNIDQLRSFLDEIDFDVLETIFHEHANKMGIAPGDVNFLGKTNITFVNENIGSFVWYNNVTNTISFNVHKKFFETWPIPPEHRKEILYRLITMVAHEIAHAVSHVGIEVRMEVKGIRKHLGKLIPSVIPASTPTIITKKVTGYDVRKLVSEDPVVVDFFFDAFNEGVNEKFSQEVVIAYLQRTGGITQSQIEKFKSKGVAYKEEVRLVDELVMLLARKLDLPSQIVWQAFVRGAWEGEDLLQGEVAEELNKAIKGMSLAKVKLLSSGVKNVADRLARLREQNAA